MTGSHRFRFFRSSTRYWLMTVNSPDRFDFTYRFWYVGSMDCDTPVMLAIVAVGAIAIVLLLRMPVVFTRSRSASQWNAPEVDVSCCRYLPSLRSFASSLIESSGRMPWLHSEPLKLG